MGELRATISAMLRRAMRPYLMARARLRGRAFFCTALAGHSDSNLCINSDLTVTCSCHDVDGSGRIGDLKCDSLEAILAGPTAARFRAELAQGRLPTPLCVRCCDLRTVAADQAIRLAAEHRLPSFVAVENTSDCNLRCASCPRLWIRRLRTKRSMSLHDVERVAEELKAAGVARLGYLNFGEPFLSRNIRRELEILREVCPWLWITTSTNAMPIDSDEKREAALLMDKIQISLHGIDQRTAAKYQRGIVFQRSYDNMQALAEYRKARGLARPVLVWKYLLFRWNDRPAYLLRAIEMGRMAGVDEICFEKTVSPLDGLSWRWLLGMLNGVGRPSGDEICIDLRPTRELQCTATAR